MALDWNREIKLSDLTGSKDANEIPSKTTMNLYQPSTSGKKGAGKIVAFSILGVLLLAAVIKFGVVDQFASVRAAEERLSGLQAQVNDLESQLTDYNEILEDYEGYTAQYASTDVDIDSVFELVENAVMPHATVESMDLTGGVLTLRIANVPLNTVGSIVYAVNTYPIARSVNVSTAATSEDVTRVTADMTIVLTTTGDVVSESSHEGMQQSDLFSNLDTNGHNVLATSMVAGAGLR